MKPLALNLLTSSVTLLVLVALTLPAKRALAPPAPEPSAVSAVPAAWPRPATEPERVFGVYTDPWHLDDWARSLGVAPQLVAKFEAFSLRRTLDARGPFALPSPNSNSTPSPSRSMSMPSP